MKTSFISNLSVNSAMRSTINQVQNELIQSQKEVVTGQLYNIGETLGGTTTRALDLRRERDMMDNLMATNSVVTQRLSSSQMALETISDAGQTALNTYVALAGSTDSTQLSTAVQTLTNVIDQFVDAANTSVNGEYIFAGINTDVKPTRPAHEPFSIPRSRPISGSTRTTRRRSSSRPPVCRAWRTSSFPRSSRCSPAGRNGTPAGPQRPTRR
jgi:flagellin-like hook-associated protein FlgL